MGICKKPLVRSRQNSGGIYLWCPPQNNFGPNPEMVRNSRDKFFCNATPYSLGEDWVTKYAYTVNVVNSVAQHDAYVECDYVQ